MPIVGLDVTLQTNPCAPLIDPDSTMKKGAPVNSWGSLKSEALVSVQFAPLRAPTV